MTMWGIFFWPVGKFSFTVEAKKMIQGGTMMGEVALGKFAKFFIIYAL